MTFWQKMKKAISAAMAGIFLLGSPSAKSLEGMLSPKTAYAEEDVSALVREGEKRMMANKVSEAENMFLEVLKKDPTNYSVHNNLGMIYERQNRIEESIKEFNTAINIDPKKTNAYTGLGFLYSRKLADYNTALEFYQQALKINPNEFVIYGHIGFCYKELKKYQEAIAMFDEYLKHKSDKYVEGLRIECKQLLISQK